MKLANVSSVTMTNDPFDDNEREKWEAGGTTDTRFQTALRIDPLLIQWEQAWVKLVTKAMM